jgi:hypothetical protein
MNDQRKEPKPASCLAGTIIGLILVVLTITLIAIILF